LHALEEKRFIRPVGYACSAHTVDHKGGGVQTRERTFPGTPARLGTALNTITASGDKPIDSFPQKANTVRVNNNICCMKERSTG